MFVKIRSCLLCYLFLGSLIPQTRSLRHEDINWSYVKYAAIWVGNLLEENKELIQHAPKIYKLIKRIATDNSFLTANPALAVTTVYFTALISMSYHYSVEAQKQLMKVQFKQDELRLIVKTEIIPTLEFLDRMLAKEDLGNFCKVLDNFRNLLANVVSSLQTIRKDIEQNMLDSTTGSERNQILQWISATGGVILGAILMVPCITTGFLVCPPVYIGGSATSFFSSLYVFFKFGSNKMTHEETLAVLNVTRIETLEAEEAARRSRTEIEFACAEYATEKTANFVYEKLESLWLDIKVSMPKQLQLKYDKPKTKYAQLDNEL